MHFSNHLVYLKLEQNKKKLEQMDEELSKVFVVIQFDPERSFAASPEDQKYQSFPKYYWKIYLKFEFDEAATDVKKFPYDLLGSKSVP